MAKEKKQKAPVDYGKLWAERLVFSVVCAILAAIANTIYGWRTKAAVMVWPWECWAALLYMLVIIFVSYALHDLLAKVLPFDVPGVLYLAVLGAVLSFPAIDVPLGGIFGLEGGLMATTFAKFYGLLPLCTPVLAFAGIASGKELKNFKQQGFAIVCIALLTFIGTYIGSAVIAQIVLNAQGVI